MSPDMAAIHILILAAVFCVLGLIAGALIYVLLSIVVSLLKIGLLLVAAVVVSVLVMRGCTPTIGKDATEKTSAQQIGLKSQIDHGQQRIRLR
jgi:membrane protein implicated in regulation of membrane protease activity